MIVERTDFVSKQEGLKQLRVAETEKYPHVTFFFDDYREHKADPQTMVGPGGAGDVALGR